MKALVLAAGFGTRLKPYTLFKPKPLFTVAGRPILDIIIRDLERSGCREIFVNTHHRSSEIDAYVTAQHYSVPVHTHYEPCILGTGGAIKNLEDVWDDRPFMVINSDILTDIDFRSVYAFHLDHPHPVTLVLNNCPEFNTVSVDPDGFVTGFPADSPVNIAAQLTFTGIQVIDPTVIEDIPGETYSTSIELYRSLIEGGEKIKAHIPADRYWNDLGTPKRYQETVMEKMGPMAFQNAFAADSGPIRNKTKLAGDGSDRAWYRLKSDRHTMIFVDHGIKPHTGMSEADSFIRIGSHLYACGIPVPKIYLSDSFSGLVYMEDLGDVHLQSLVEASPETDRTYGMYRKIIRLLIDMSIRGSINFNPDWTYQTASYDRNMIIEKECRYFIDAFLNRFMKRNFPYDRFETDFENLAEKAVRFGTGGFMHRDFQSRNIMRQKDRFYFIDFQAGRMGPIQYDLAALLIDPYVCLPRSMQDRLLDDCARKYASETGIPETDFVNGYRYCAITRNLQILGAFGYLTCVKKKNRFARYIPSAVETLKQNLSSIPQGTFPALSALVAEL